MAASIMSNDASSVSEDESDFYSLRLKLNERLTLVYQKVKMTLTKVVLMLAILVLRNKVSVIFCKLL